MIIIQMEEAQFKNLLETTVREAQRQVLDSQNSPSEQWLSVQDLCNYLPMNCSPKKVYEWTSKKFIPFHKKTKSLFFLKSEIDVWLKSGRFKTALEINANSDTFKIGHKKAVNRRAA